MTLYCLLCTLLLCAQSEADLTSELLQDNTTTCPTWTYWEQSEQACACGDGYRRTVSCDVNGSYYNVRISKGYCMTLDATKTREVIGACRFYRRWSWSLIPRNSSLLQSRVCDYVSRTGQLCKFLNTSYRNGEVNYWKRVPKANNSVKVIVSR